MKRISISIFASFVAALLIPMHATAQSSSGLVGEVFRQEGIASWYGAQFAGRPTASGEIFDPSQFTAAHPTLPFGTFLIVTNRDNNRQVSVRVNDRGPFVGGRIIDVSQAAAEHLGMLVTGTAPVMIETIPMRGQQPPQGFMQAQQQPPQPFAQPQVQQPPQAFEPQQPAHVSTMTIPVDVPNNAPITINIFHVADPSMPQGMPNGVSVVQDSQLPDEVWIEHLPRGRAAVSPEGMVIADISDWPMEVQTEPVSMAQPAVLEVWHSPVAMGVGNVPAINPNGMYRVQVGSFRVARNAVDTFVRLSSADFQPSYEQNGEFFRVVLPGIRGMDVQPMLERLATMGYYDTLIRRDF